MGALPGGAPVVVSGDDEGMVYVWRLADGTRVGEPIAGHDGTVQAVAVGAMPDGTPVIISGGADKEDPIRVGDRTVRVWRLADGRRAGKSITGHHGVTAVVVGTLPDGTPVIVSAGYEGTVRVWRLAGRRRTGKPIAGHTGRVTALAVGTLPDGTPVIVSGDEDGTVRVWRLACGTPVGEPIIGHTGRVSAVAVGTLPDGTPVIVSGGAENESSADGEADSTVRVWRLADGTPLAHPLDLSEPIRGIALYGNIVVTATGEDIAAHRLFAP